MPDLDPVAVRAAFAALKARVDAMERASGLFVEDKDLDAPNGNPKVKFPPRQWRGADFKGKLFSECPPEFLEMLADALRWSADHPKAGTDPETAAKWAKYGRADARRAMSWARRLRAKAIVLQFEGQRERPPALAPEAAAELFDDDDPAPDSSPDLFDDEDDDAS